MWFELCNAPATLQALMNQGLEPDVDEYVVQIDNDKGLNDWA
jgi:hypothetical protein